MVKKNKELPSAELKKIVREAVRKSLEQRNKRGRLKSMNAVTIVDASKADELKKTLEQIREERKTLSEMIDHIKVDLENSSKDLYRLKRKQSELLAR